MAQGTISLFNEYAESIADGRIVLDTHTFKFALTSTVPADTDAVPTWGAGGTTNESTNEVTAGGGYTAGGIAAASVTWSQTSGVGTFDAANITWTSSASGDPANIKSLIMYSDTATNKDCVGWMDMTTDGGTTAISLLSGDITVTWNASGLFTVTV